MHISVLTRCQVLIQENLDLMVKNYTKTDKTCWATSCCYGGEATCKFSTDIVTFHSIKGQG